MCNDAGDPMCGIAGLLQPSRRAFQRAEAMSFVERMNACIAHRGPDADGVWADADGRCVLGQRRLSIIDTSDAGTQPFASGDGRWWITFNGEIYNVGEVRAELERAGVRFRGRTDTEVLVEAIAFWGIFPGTIVFSMVYSEGLSLALIAGAMRALQDRRWVLAGLLAATASAVEPVVFAIIPAFGGVALLAGMAATVGGLAWLGERGRTAGSRDAERRLKAARLGR